ncbi:MAG: mannitol dehydrogenase-like protein [Subtercola sp.]|nr:mannitol dehydrogenase-like protein [Subtercola sp.]
MSEATATVAASSAAVLPLRAETLVSLAGRLPVPQYDRTAVTTGVVHFGVGGFHRAHQAMIVDRLLSRGEATDFGICGVGVLESDRRIRDVLAKQDGLYTLVVKHGDGTVDGRVIGSIVEYLFAPDDPEAVLEKLAAPATRIVSLTITEGGYNVDPLTGLFDASDAAVMRDLTSGAAPATVFGLVTEALRRRRDRAIAPFTVMSCDNIQGNGHTAAAAFTSFARLHDPDLADWIAETVAFPNTMVDRITPVTTDADRDLVRERFGIDDLWPVVCEPFLQWVIEDEFALGRPAYEEEGAQIVADVEPYELMKLRLLNASHQALAYFGYLAGYRYAHEAAADPALARLVREYMTREAQPTLAPVPGVDLEVYKATMLERFANPFVRDTLARLCAESSDRIPKFILPALRDRIAAGGDVSLGAAIVASWARYDEGEDEGGQPIDIVDRLKDDLTARARRYADDPEAFVNQRSVFGELGSEERFMRPYLNALRSLHEHGSRETYAGLV